MVFLWTHGGLCQVRAEDLDANMSKISEDKHLGIWRGPNVYSYFDTRIVRHNSAAKRRGF